MPNPNGYKALIEDLIAENEELRAEIRSNEIARCKQNNAMTSTAIWKEKEKEFEKDMLKVDAENHPAMRQAEMLKFIRTYLTREEFSGYCKGCMIRYSLEDVSKVEAYVDAMNHM